uniref:protein ZW2-like n=1 Tax=Erigeron canadensis TaxID=72917 RepID=UPI001CB9C844|nr:protein ZW2-like [Erigeron canadensis]
MTTTTNTSTTQETFTAFYDGWLNRHNTLQQQLTTIIRQSNNNINVEHNEQLHKLIQQVSTHYQQYFDQKSLAIEEDIFLVCSPPWFTPFEQALFWVTEYPPSLVFRCLNDLNLTTDQAQKVETVRAETARKELEIGEAMAMVQESLAAAPLYGLVNRAERLVDGEIGELDDAMEEVKEAMRVVLVAADGLRGKAVGEVLSVLEVAQKVKFFAAIGEFRIRARRVGLGMGGG